MGERSGMVECTFRGMVVQGVGREGGRDAEIGGEMHFKGEAGGGGGPLHSSPPFREPPRGSQN